MRVFAVLLSSILLCSFIAHEARAQEEPPLIPPLILYGTAYKDGTPLTASDTGYTISMAMEWLLLIFLNGPGSQTLVGNIISQLDVENKTALQQAFIQSSYCQSRGLSLSPGAVVDPRTPGSEWWVTDGGNTYKVTARPIPVWDGGWMSGHLLEVYLSEGVIAEYTMGSDPRVGNYYALQIPMSSAEVYGGLPPSDTYVLRAPGKAQEQDIGFIRVHNIDIIDPPLPYVFDQEAFVEMDIYAPSAYEYTLNLLPGWNLISLPIQPENPSRDVVLQDIAGMYSSIWRYITALGSWVLYDADQQTGTLNTVEARVGYWIDMKQAAQLTVRGSMPATAIYLEAGWNLVGYTSLQERNIDQCLVSILNNCISVWTYVTSLSSWVVYETDPGGSKTLKSMKPSLGYWIETNAPCEWDIGP